MEIFNCEQGSDEWKRCRSAIITASSMSKVLSSGKEALVRKKYMYELIGEIITGEPAEMYSNKHMERGHEMEPVARQLYADYTGVEAVQVGFIRNKFEDIILGYSPDSLISHNGLMEAKSRLPHIQAELLDKGEIPSTVKAQLQTGLLVSERGWIDYVSYWPGMPLFVKRQYRDEKYIENIIAESKRFYDEMNEKINRIQRTA